MLNSQDPIEREPSTGRAERHAMRDDTTHHMKLDSERAERETTETETLGTERDWTGRGWSGRDWTGRD
jgi:hypothetical protein